MKKRLSSALLFLALITMATTASALTRYTIKGERVKASELKTDGTKYVFYNTGNNSKFFIGVSVGADPNSDYVVTTTDTPASFETTDDSYIWQLEPGDTEGSYKIKNVGTGKYSAGGSTNRGGTSVGDTGNDYTIADYVTCAQDDKGPGVQYWIDGANIKYDAITEEHRVLYIKDLTTSTKPYWNGDGTLGFVTQGKGHAYAFYEVAEEVLNTVEVTYKVVLNGETLKTATVEDVIGNAPQVPEALNADFTTFTYSVTEINENTTEVIATPTFNMPFVTSTSADNATWYCIKAHASYNNMYIYTNGDDIVWTQAIGENADAYYWAFIGNPITGVKLINKATGNKYLSTTNPLTMAEGEGKAWALKRQTANYANCGGKGFGLYDSGLTYVNAQDGTLKFWGSFDQGSTFWVQTFSEIIDQLESYDYGDELGQYSFTGDYSGKTVEDVKGDADKVNEAIGMLYSVTYNQPKAGMFLRITGMNNKHLAAGISKTGPYMYTTAEDATTIFYCDGDHLINLSTGLTVGMTNGNSATEGWGWEYGTETGSTVTYSKGSTSGKYSLYIGKGGSFAYLKDNGDADCVRRGSPANSANFDWTLTEIKTLPITVSEVGYATLYSPVALTIPADGVTAYTGTLNDDNSTLILTKVEGTIPANTPVVLEGEGSHAFAVATTGETAPTQALQGSLGLAGTQNILTLQMIDDVPGFYKYNNEAGLPAFKVYIDLTGIKSNALRVVFDDDITAIEGVEAADSDAAAYYDLQGRRVAAPQAGQLYIVNGKKILVK